MTRVARRRRARRASRLGDDRRGSAPIAASRRSSGCTAAPTRCRARRPARRQARRPAEPARRVGRPARAGAGRLLRHRRRRRDVRDARPRHGAVGVGRRRGGEGQQPVHIFNRQATWAAIGLVGLLVAHADAPAWLRRLAIPASSSAWSAMALPFVPGVGATRQRRPGVGDVRRVQRPAVGVPQAGPRRVRRRPARAPPGRAVRRAPQPAADRRRWPSSRPAPAWCRATSARRS